VASPPRPFSFCSRHVHPEQARLSRAKSRGTGAPRGQLNNMARPELRLGPFCYAHVNPVAAKPRSCRRPRVPKLRDRGERVPPLWDESKEAHSKGLSGVHSDALLVCVAQGFTPCRPGSGDESHSSSAFPLPLPVARRPPFQISNLQSSSPSGTDIPVCHPERSPQGAVEGPACPHSGFSPNQPLNQPRAGLH